MEFRLRSPINCHRDARAKEKHVKEGNRQESFHALLLQHNGIEPGHHYRDRDAQHNHERGERRSEPAECAVHADFRERTKAD